MTTVSMAQVGQEQTLGEERERRRGLGFLLKETRERGDPPRPCATREVGEELTGGPARQREKRRQRAVASPGGAVANQTGPAQQREMGGEERREVRGPAGEVGQRAKIEEGKGRENYFFFFPNKFSNSISK